MTQSQKAAGMPDVQGSEDTRQVAIDRVGVKGIRYPITLATPGGEPTHTVAEVNMYVALPHHKKGTHMSRFLEVLNTHHRALKSCELVEVTEGMRQLLNAPEAHLQLEFPYFLHRSAPITGKQGYLDITASFEVVVSEHEGKREEDFILTVKVPAKSLCPCSKEISEYGAHNQRCHMEAAVRFKPGTHMWIEDVVALIENCASTQVYPILKRPDEKFVTEDAYENPKFVEDIVRDLALALDAEEKIVWFRVSSENFESIHNHNAYAVVERDKRN